MHMHTHAHTHIHTHKHAHTQSTNIQLAASYKLTWQGIIVNYRATANWQNQKQNVNRQEDDLFSCNIMFYNRSKLNGYSYIITHIIAILVSYLHSYTIKKSSQN